ncbi:hypothetical protein B0H13DRAFT_1877920 [Mycena leptocephala]|nr:hypothetical protein B0H13DRAFT_1877920 [Mycena leptocephala]
MATSDESDQLDPLKLALWRQPVRPTLPTELERAIFELAAFFDPDSLPVLLLVAHRVKIWYCPSSRLAPGFQRLMDRKPASFFHDYVRHIQIYISDTEEITKILSLCDATVSLALYAPDGPALLPPLSTLRVRRLNVWAQALFPDPTARDFSHPFFSQITHLFLLDSDRDGDWGTWSTLAQMPRLTHLSFYSSRIANSVCRGALEHCKALEVLAIWCVNQTKLETNIPRRAELAYDVRFVMVVVEGVEKFLADWESGAQGGEDYWVRAEALVQKRRAGETDQHALTLSDFARVKYSPAPFLLEFHV